MGDARVGERYAIDGGVDGKRRLNLLAEIMRPTTLALLDRVGVGDGLHCLDLGCGGGHVAIDMARLVGATGRVVGVDFDATVIELARPGGVVDVEDTDFSGFFCEPPDPAHDEYARLYSEAVALSGGDSSIGRRLPGMVAAAGLADVELAVCQPAHLDGPLKVLNQVTMERIRPRVVDAGLATDAEVDAVAAGMRAFSEREGTLVALPLIVKAWGRRPAPP